MTPISKCQNLRDFEIVKGPYTWRNLNLSKGVESASVVYYYYLRPKRLGVCQTGVATVMVNGDTFQSNNLSILITQSITNPQDVLHHRNSPRPYNDPVTNFSFNGTASSGNSTINPKKETFIKVVCSKDSMMMGDSILVTYLLYLRPGVKNINLEHSPKQDNFNAQEIRLEQKQIPSQIIRNGKAFNVYELFKYNLTPRRVGKFYLGIIKMTIEASPTGQSPWGAEPTISFEVESPPTTIVVKEKK